MFAFFNELSANGSIQEDSLPAVLRTLYECIDRLKENHVSSICIDQKIGQYQLTANRWFLDVLDDKTIVDDDMKTLFLDMMTTIENPMQDENANVDTKLFITNKNFEVKANGDVECNIDVEVDTEFSQNVSMNIIDDIEAQEFTKNIDDYDSLIIYIVQKGDTLWKIAKRFRSTVEDISRVNGIEDPNQIQVGQKIYIPKHVKMSMVLL